MKNNLTFAALAVLGDLAVSAGTDGVGSVVETELLAASVVHRTQVGALLLLPREHVDVLERVSQPVLQKGVVRQVGERSLLDAASLVGAVRYTQLYEVDRTSMNFFIQGK